MRSAVAGVVRLAIVPRVRRVPRKTAFMRGSATGLGWSRRLCMYWMPGHRRATVDGLTPLGPAANQAATSQGTREGGRGQRVLPVAWGRRFCQPIAVGCVSGSVTRSRECRSFGAGGRRRFHSLPWAAALGQWSFWTWWRQRTLYT